MSIYQKLRAIMRDEGFNPYNTEYFYALLKPYKNSPELL